jgi:hypothetical protein
LFSRDAGSSTDAYDAPVGAVPDGTTEADVPPTAVTHGLSA